jgi:Flp pilus assembly protein protease CpaA
MFEIYFLFVLALVWILFAVVQDIRTREIANWLNFSLVIFALGFRFFYSLFERGEFSFFYQGIIGFAIFYLLGNLFYYSRMFAGGDAKLVMALGAILPFSNVFYENLQFFILFIFLIFIAGSIYGLAGTFYFSFRSFGKFKKEFNLLLNQNKKLVNFSLVFAIVLIGLGFFLEGFFWLGVLVFIFPYIYIYTRAVDESCMVKKVFVKDVTEGDWLYREIKIGKKVIKPSWGGLTKKDLNLIRKNKKYVLLRYGIQFSPVFLISFILYFFIWKIGFESFLKLFSF